MKWDTRKPCGSCPYRKDAPLGLWHPENLDRLAESEAEQFGALYGCHATIRAEDPSVCAGWLLVQQANGTPSLNLRLAVMSDPKAEACALEVSADGLELYGSVAEMIAANEALGRCKCGRYLSGKAGTCPECGPFIFDCGCSVNKVALGRCDHYGPDGKEREDDDTKQAPE